MKESRTLTAETLRSRSFTQKEPDFFAPPMLYLSAPLTQEYLFTDTYI